MIGIYKITNPKGKIYIGSSKNIKKRFNDYQKKRCKSQPRLYNSLVKYGVENHSFEIIWICDEEYLYFFERIFGEKKQIITEDTKLKISKSNKGNKYCLGRKISEETKKKISNSLIGKKQTEETKNKVKLKRQIPNNGWFKKGKLAINKRKILDLNTNKIYNSLTEYSEINNIKISKVCYILRKVKNPYLIYID